ncbi:broad specificity phosphatase PhoE [Silvibacterium bohemicum]|uniref:Broad specificity phosphatase PhoE n=1 Tax=Silvibacterium bohemicum TaxID=1577686 RepID=A0A841JWX0_9BACT|nr:histidine phosphatase family protein [Silvibacterium bohemicum]MBB6144937.1 broad specificity phosphatase PhoE [Silvibacterium bohemicum]
MTARLTLITHAPTNAQRQAAFPLDEPVTDQELAKVAAFNWIAPRAQQTLSGPELRTQQTARALGLSPIVESGLRDCDYGSWRGRGIEEVQSEDPECIVAWLREPEASPHGGESIATLIGRTGRWMQEIEQEGQRDAGHVLAVTHPAVVRAAIVHALVSPPQTFWRIDIAPLSLTDLRFNGSVWTVRSTGCSLQRSHQAKEEDSF